MTRLLGDDWVLPALDDFNRPWFTSGTIQLQACDDCGAFQQPPDELCGSCQGKQLSFRECPGEGRIESVAVVHQAVHPALKSAVPYAVVVVSIDAAPSVSVIGNVVGTAPAELRIGQRVRACFEECVSPENGEALKIPLWEIA